MGSSCLDIEALEFIDNGAPTVQADVLHDLVLIGSIGLFTACYLKQSPSGVWYKEAAFYARLPKEAIPPAVALTMRKMGIGEIVPAIGSVVRSLMRVH